MNVSFPLRDNYFRPLQHTPEDEARWRRFVEGLVDSSLQEEKPYYTSHYSYVDTAQWKLLREKDQLRVYRPRSSSASSSHAGRGSGNSQTVLTVGTIEGTLEDVIYGIHHVTTQDMRVTTAFLSDDAMDSAVIHIFDNGTEEDEYRSFAVKWRLIETPAGGLVKNRDGVVLEYMGIDVDEQGQRYAFHVTETFDHPVCPPFSTHCAIRAKAHVRTIYRQVSPGRVGVYFLGDYSLSGKIPGIVARFSTVEIAVSIGKSVECSEAKKLTALALAGSPVLHKRRAASGSMTQCSICKTTPGRLSTRSLGLCHLCGLCVCSKCRSRKYLLSDEKKIAVSCCKQCIVAAKNLTIDPRLPLRLITAALWRSENVLKGDDIGWEQDVRSVENSMLSTRSRGALSSDGSWSSSERGHKRSATLGRRTNSVDSDNFSGRRLTSESSTGSVELLSEEATATLSSRRPERKMAAGETAVQLRPAPSQPGNEQAQLWMQMNQLRLAAEETYQLTHNNTRMLARAALSS